MRRRKVISRTQKKRYESAKEEVKKGTLDYVPFVPWQPIQHELYREAIEGLFLLNKQTVLALQAAYDAEMTSEIFVNNLNSDIFTKMSSDRKIRYIDNMVKVFEESQIQLRRAHTTLQPESLLKAFFLNN